MGYMRDDFVGKLLGPSHCIFLHTDKIKGFLRSLDDIWLEAENLLNKIAGTWPGSIFRVFLLSFFAFGFAIAFLLSFCCVFLQGCVSSTFFSIFKLPASSFIELNYISLRHNLIFISKLPTNLHFGGFS